MTAKELFSAPAQLAYSEPEQLVQDFASRGLVVLAPESLGIPTAVHERIYQREKQVVGTGERVTPELIPDVLEVINAPGVVAACNQLVGENWAIVPFTHNATFTSGGRDQHWHKDDNGPFNGRKQRHHQAVQIEMLYYPQAVREDMGPTATVPYSHYWTFNHEENHDNFAGPITSISPINSAAWRASLSAVRIPNTIPAILSIAAPRTTCACGRQSPT